MSVKVSVICFKSKVLANGEHPIVLRISENKKKSNKEFRHILMLLKIYSFCSLFGCLYCCFYLYFLCLLFIFSYIVDYYIYKALEEPKTEE